MAVLAFAPFRCSTKLLTEESRIGIAAVRASRRPSSSSSIAFPSSRKWHSLLAKSSSKAVDLVLGNRDRYEYDDESDDSDDDGGEDAGGTAEMTEEERVVLRKKIWECMEQFPEVAEETDPEMKKAKVRELLARYPLVVDEEDPDWPEDAEGRGFKMDQFFNHISIKCAKKEDGGEDYDSEEEIVWQDDDYIKPMRDVTAKDWEDTVFKDFNPLVILVHHRYRRPKENERAMNELVMAVETFWRTGLPSPRCVAVDACAEHELVEALNVSGYPEILFTKAGKILHRDREVRTAEEWSKIMAFFYYKAARPPCLEKTAGEMPEKIPSLQEAAREAGEVAVDAGGVAGDAGAGGAGAMREKLVRHRRAWLGAGDADGMPEKPVRHRRCWRDAREAEETERSPSRTVPKKPPRSRRPAIRR